MSNTRIIAEIQTQADTRQLERAAKLLDEFSDAVKKGGKDAGIAYKATLSSVDKLILKQAQLKKALINERDTAKIDKYSKALVGVGQRLDVIAQKSAKVSKTQSGGGGLGSNGTAALLGSLGGGVSGIAGALGGLAGGPIGAAVSGLAVDLGGALVETSKNALNAAAEMEGLKTQIEAFAGTRVGTEIFREIEKFALENPVANLQESLRGTAMLLQEGFSAQESVDIIKQLTDVTKGNTDQFQRMSRALSQVKGAGRLMGEELNQLRDAGFNPLIEISKRTGESMAKLKKRMEAGGISAKEVADALKDATSEGGRFYNMSKNLAGTVTGDMAAMEDSTTKLSASFGNFVYKYGGAAFLGWLNRSTQSLSRFLDLFNSKTIEGEIFEINKTLGKLSPNDFGNQSGVVRQYISGIRAGLSEADAKSKFGISESDLKIAEAVNQRLIDIEKKTQQDRTKLREAGEKLGFADKIFNFGKPDEVEKAAKTIADIEASEAARRAFLIDKKAGEELSKSEAYELKRLILKKKSTQELSDAERKALRDLNKQQAEADKKYLDDVNEANKKLEKAFLDRQSRLAEIQDKISITNVSENQTTDAIKQKYAIELAAELREIEANKQAIDKEIVVYNSEQAAKKIQLLQSFESEKTAITELYRINEAKDTKEHNEELVKAEKELKERILQLRRENIEGTFELVRQNFDNEAEILRIRESLAIESINKQFDAEKEAINEKVKLGLDATNLLLELENQRQGALTISEKRFNKERLELNDKYFNEYLSKLQEFTQRAQLVQENDFSRERIALQEQYNNGLIGRSKYYKELEILDKEQELKRAKYNLAGLVQESVAIQGEILDGNLSADEKEALKKRREQLKVEIEKAGLEVSQIQANQGTEVITKQQEQLQAAADFGVQIAQLAADSMGAILQAQIDAIDNTIAVQEDRLQNARSLAEAGFTANLQQEQDKLELLQQKREAFVRRQVIIDNIARISAQALALANAIAGASTTGPAAPFTIAAAAASVLATIATSVAQARSFNTGTAWLTPANSKQGRIIDDIPIMANKGEGIIPTAQNERFNAITKAMIEGNPKSIALAALQYPSIKKFLIPDYGAALAKVPNQQANHAQTVLDMKKHIDRLEKLIGDITIVNNSTDVRFDADGVSKFSTKRAEKIKNIRNKI